MLFSVSRSDSVCGQYLRRDRRFLHTAQLLPLKVSVVVLRHIRNEIRHAEHNLCHFLVVGQVLSRPHYGIVGVHLERVHKIAFQKIVEKIGRRFIFWGAYSF